MNLSAQRSLVTICLVCAAALTAVAQTRTLDLKEGGTLAITNNYGRVAITAVPRKDEETSCGINTYGSFAGARD